MNIKDIAQLCGLSKSTVSRYLNGGSVSKGAAERISAVIQETGFEANVFASRLKSHRSFLIGVLIEGIVSESVARNLTGINVACRTQGFQPFIVIDNYGEDNKVQGMKSLVQQGVDGIIFGSGAVSQEHRDYFATCEKPVIILGQRDDALPYCKVNDCEGGRLLGEHIAQQGAKHVAWLSFPLDDLAAGAERTQGLVDALTMRNVLVDVLETKYSMEDGYKAAERALSSSPDFLACASDTISLGVLEYLEEHGIKTPDEIGLASFGNHSYGSLPSVSLTSIEFDYYALGYRTAQKAIALVNGEEITRTDDSFMPRLIVRNSSLISRVH